MSQQYKDEKVVGRAAGDIKFYGQKTNFLHQQDSKVPGEDSGDSQRMMPMASSAALSSGKMLSWIFFLA